MTRVHPNVHPPPPSPTATEPAGEGKEEAVTVWSKSLMFNCDGFAVFDRRGDLRFRVDNYSGGRKGTEIVLMDACGSSILTIRRKRLSLTETWLIYEGDESVDPLFSVRKHVTFLHPKKLAHVAPHGERGLRSYAVEGSYTRRRCTIYDGACRAVGEVQRKESGKGVALGGDVFRLVVQPGLDLAIAMAIVIVLERMYR